MKTKNPLPKWALYLAVAVIAILPFAGCDNSSGPSGDSLPKRYFKDSVQVIFDAHCIGCHSNGNVGWSATGADSTGLDLTKAYASLVNKRTFEHEAGDSVPVYRVRPGSPDSSFLYHKLNLDAPEAGSRMPLEDSRLPDSEIAVIKKWILHGAPLGDTTTH